MNEAKGSDGLPAASLAARQYKEVYMKSVPLELLFAISKDRSAIRNFVTLSECDRAALLTRVSKCRNREEIECVAMALADDNSATENH